MDLATAYADSAAMQAQEEESKAKGVCETSSETSNQSDRKRSWETFNNFPVRDKPTDTNATGADSESVSEEPATRKKCTTSSKLVDSNGFWTCHKCSYNVNPTSSVQCLHCSASKNLHNADAVQILSNNGAGANDISVVTDGNVTLPGTNDKDSEMEEDGDWEESDSENDTTPWACARCNHFNTVNAFKCGNCNGWKGGKRPTKGSPAKTSKAPDNSDGGCDSITPWHCGKCNHLNTRSSCKCSGCNGWRDGKRPTKTSKTEPEIYDADEMSEEDKEEIESWTCGRLGCGHVNITSTMRCSKCAGWRGGKVPTKKNRDTVIEDDDASELDEESTSEEEGDSTPWSCVKCSHINTKSLSKCSRCMGWKDGKRPTKSTNEYVKTFTKSSADSAKLPPILSKKEYKPLFEVNDPVYAPWFSSGQSRAEQTWYPGVIKGYTTVKNGAYGPTRHYDVRFDDGDELDDIEDYCIFSREDYLLSAKKEWIGVENKTDNRSSDQWAKLVGWYEVTIGEATYVFSQLYEALKAHDAHMAGENCELNLPDEIINKHKSCTSNSLDEPENETNYSSEYRGVSLVQQSGKYRARISAAKNTHVLGSYVLAADAAWIVDRGLEKLGFSSNTFNFHTEAKYKAARKKEAKERGMNLPPLAKEQATSKVKDLAVEEFAPITHPSASTYYGVSLVKASGKYQSCYDRKDKKIYLGIYDLCTDAAWAYDECCRQIGSASDYPVNFACKRDYIKARKIEMNKKDVGSPFSEIQTYIDSKVSKAVSKASTADISSNCNEKKLGDDYGSSSPKYKGVTFNKKQGKYHVTITLGKQLFIGSYKLKSDSAWAYDECCRQLDLSPVNFALKTDYTNARKIEQKLRGLTVPLSEVQTYIATKVNNVVSNAAAQLPQKNISVARDDNSPLKERDVLKKKRSFSSQYQGVSLMKREGTYHSYINIGIPKKKYFLGTYQMEADAALAVDKSLRQLGSPTVNFDNISEYSKARKEEAEKRGIDVPRSEVQAYMTEKINNAVSSSNRRNDQTSSEGNLSPSLAQSTEQSKTLPVDIKIYAKYNGVSFDKSRTKYLANVYHGKKLHYLGRYELGADAAFTHDECARVVNDKGLSTNFATEDEYEAARADESEKRGIDVSRSDVSSLIKDQVDKFASAVGKSSRGTDAIQFSSVSHVTSNGFAAPIESQTVALNATIKEKHFSTQVIPNKTKLILLTPDQIKNLRYPTGTTIWWNEGSNASDEIYKDGTVSSIFFDMNSRDLLYEVLPKNQLESVFFLEHDIAYAPPSPVLVSPDFEESNSQSARDLINQGEDLLKGNLLLSKRVGQDWVYTVNTIDGNGGIKLLENVPSKCVTLQKI